MEIEGFAADFRPEAIASEGGKAMKTRDTALVIDDQEGARAVLRAILMRHGLLLEEAASFDEAIAFIQTVKFDVVILSAELRGPGGIEACRTIRRTWRALPILMLGSDHSEDQKVTALESGADDYITKPCRLRELVARIRSAARRGRIAEQDSGALSIGDLQLDPERYLVFKNGRRVHMTPKEFALLQHLMLHAEVTVTYADLLSSIRGPGFNDGVEYLRTFVRNLRLKLEDNPARPRHILTDAQIGYRFSALSALGRRPEVESTERKIDRIAT